MSTSTREDSIHSPITLKPERNCILRSCTRTHQRSKSSFSCFKSHRELSRATFNVPGVINIVRTHKPHESVLTGDSVQKQLTDQSVAMKVTSFHKLRCAGSIHFTFSVKTAPTFSFTLESHCSFLGFIKVTRAHDDYCGCHWL